MDVFYPNCPWTFKAETVELDGKVVGVGGVYYQNERIIAFSSYKPELDAFPIAKVRGIKRIMKIVGDKPVFAFADERFPGAPALLERLGFEKVEGRIYRWDKSSTTH